MNDAPDTRCGGVSTDAVSTACQYCLFAGTAPRRVRPSVLFSHDSDEWATPRAVFLMLDREFGFTLDVCATTENATCGAYFTKDTNGLLADWGTHVCWMNPPYSQLNRWLHKAYQSSLRGATVVCLTFARTDTSGFHDAVKHATEIRFLRGRLRFGNARNSAPAPSCVIIFRPTTTTTPEPLQLTFGFHTTAPSIIAATIAEVPQ